MKKIFNTIIAFISLLCVFLCSCSFIDNDLLFSEPEKIDYVSIINDVTLTTMKSNVKIIKQCDGSSFLGSGGIIKRTANTGFFERKYTYYCITNNHVVAGSLLSEITVYDYQGTESKASILCNSADYDLALLEFQSDAELLAVKLSSDNPAVGDEVISIGQPQSQLNAITMGKVLEISKAADSYNPNSKVAFDVIVHDAYINNGSSGGMLVNLDLELVGVNYAGLENSETGEYLNEYCAVPVLKLKEFLTNNNFNI